MKIKLRWNNLFLVLLAGLFIYFYTLAPPTPSNALDGVMDAFTGNFTPQNIIVFVLFNLMGIWPLAMASIVLIDQKGQKLPAWPFVIASFFLGAYALTIYVGLRTPNKSHKPEKKGIVKKVDKRSNGIIILVLTILLIIWAAITGDWEYFFSSFFTNGFIHIMTIDFLLFAVIFPPVLKDDMQLRNYYSMKKMVLFSIIPLFGALIYLSLRPRIATRI